MSSCHRRRGPILVLLASVACAHTSPADSARSPGDAVQEEILRLRKEQASLRKRVQLLEDRLLQVDGGAPGAAPVAGRNLPVTRLAPGPEGPEPVPPEGRRYARTLAPASDPAMAYPTSASDAGADLDPDPADDAPSHGYEDSIETTSASPTRSFRLTGTDLVEFTKTRGPKRPDRPPRTQKGNAILADYESAMAMYKSGSFAGSEAAFEAFARTHPRHDYADNALYWKGESAYDQEHYADALAAFTEVVERYGGGNKAPDALLKIGLCYGRLGDIANAQDVLTQLIAAYPRASASRIARDKLTKLED